MIANLRIIIRIKRDFNQKLLALKISSDIFIANDVEYFYITNYISVSYG